MNVLLIGVVVHCIFAVWMYGQFKSTHDPDLGKDAAGRIQYTESIVYFVLTVLTLLFIISTWPIQFIRYVYYKYLTKVSNIIIFNIIMYPFYVA